MCGETLCYGLPWMIEVALSPPFTAPVSPVPDADLSLEDIATQRAGLAAFEVRMIAKLTARRRELDALADALQPEVDPSYEAEFAKGAA